MLLFARMLDLGNFFKLFFVHVSLKDSNIKKVFSYRFRVFLNGSDEHKCWTIEVFPYTE